MGAQQGLGGAPQLAAGFPGAAALTRSQRLACRAALEPGDVEKALTRLFAGWSELTEGEALYRGEWPAEQLDAASVKLTGELAENSPDFRNFTVRLTGREVTRGGILPALLRALGKLPEHWLTLSGGGLASPVTVGALTLADPVRIEPAAASGRRIRTLTAELLARICTAPPRGC